MSCSSSSGSEEEDEGIDSYRKGGYHAVRVGDSFNGGRYFAQRKLGWGEFSTVWLAYDTRESTYVALKIQKSAPQFAQAALHEIEILSAIANGDSSNTKCVVQLVDHFKHAGPNGQHLCMVLEFLGDSLLRLIKFNRYKGLGFNKVREICKCVLTGLDYLHRELGLIHTDLKPENILLCSTMNPSKDPIKSGMTPILVRPEGSSNGGASMSMIEKKLKQRAKRAVARISSRRASVGGLLADSKPDRCLDGIDVRCKVVDFGNACWADKQFAEEIQTRQYRAPETIIRSGYSFSADMWSFACIAFELATGEMLFTPKEGQDFSEDEDHLALMMELLGKMPRKIATGGLLNLYLEGKDPLTFPARMDKNTVVGRPERAEGLATVLAIGTATPPDFMEQSAYPDYYFKVTNSDHKTELKEKFRRICEKSMIRKRHMYLTEEHLNANPSICGLMAPSLDARQEILNAEIPKLGKEAALKSIQEWNQPISKITHLIFCTISGVEMPGADYHLTRLLGLNSSVKRLMLYLNGCFTGGTVLRVAKDIAENNKGARVLVVCSEIVGLSFHGPSESDLSGLILQALFADGAAAIIIGADPIPEVEKPLFEIVSAAQTIIPESHGAITGHLREAGLILHLDKDAPKHFATNIEKCLVEAFKPFGVSDWNSIFWVAHPGGALILDRIQEKLDLKPEKLRATRHVLSEYGNMSSVCVCFILDEMRRSSINEGLGTTGEGLEWGVLFGFGPGLTVDTVVLRSVAI